MKLIEHFIKNRKKVFTDRIERAQTWGDIAREITKEFDFYTTPGNEYLNDLNNSQRKFFLALIEQVKTLYSEIIHTVIASPSSEQRDTDRTGESQMNTNNKVAEEGKRKQLWKQCKNFSLLGKKEKNDDDVSSRQDNPRVEINLDSLLQIVQSSINKIDTMVDNFSYKSAEKAPIEIHKECPELMGLIQSVFSIEKHYSAKDFSGIMIPQFQSILWGLGYEQRSYELNSPLTELSKVFDISYSQDETKYIICQPIFKADKLIEKGKLVMPKNN